MRPAEERPECQGRSDRYPAPREEVYELLQGLMKAIIHV